MNTDGICYKVDDTVHWALRFSSLDGQTTSEGSTPVRTQQIVSSPLCVFRSFFFLTNCGYFSSELRRPDREIDSPPQTIAEFHNARSCNSALHDLVVCKGTTLPTSLLTSRWESSVGVPYERALWTKYLTENSFQH